MKIITELKKGCGKGIRFNSIEGVSYQVCCDKNELCPTCQALLTQSQEFEKLIDKIFYYETINGKIPIISLEKLEELKLSLTGKKNE